MTNSSRMYGAIARGDIEAVRALIASDPTIMKTYVVNQSWLHWAAEDGNTEMMETFVNAGLSIDQLTNEPNQTPLKSAATQGQYEACKWLLDRGADINRGLGESATPIFSAIYSKSLELVKLFVERGADLSATFGPLPKINVVGFAETYGTPEIVSFLKERLNSQES